MKVRFENHVEHNRTHYSDIVLNNNVVGCLIEKEKALLKPIKTFFQRCVKDTKKAQEVADFTYISEDVGNIFICFNTLDKFLKHALKFN